MRSEQRQEVVARRLGRIAGLEADDPADVAEAPVVPGLIPIPGRHARRRAGAHPGLRGPALDGRHLGVIALIACAGLAVALWWMLARTPTIQTDLTSSSGTASSTAAAATSSGSGAPLVDLDATGASPTAVTIDVAGRVRRPGVRTLPAGSRVVDALAAAGGARRGADLSGINQARLLVDGEQILVGRRGAPGSSTGSNVPSSPGAPGASSALVNLNTASAQELDTLPGVGPVTAAAILDYRTQHGGFAAVAELLDVDGIGEATLAKLEPHVTV